MFLQLSVILFTGRVPGPGGVYSRGGVPGRGGLLRGGGAGGPPDGYCCGKCVDKY